MNGRHPTEVIESERLRDVFSSTLEELMQAHGVSFEALLARTNIHENSLRAYLSGERLPRLSQLVELADTLGVTLNELIPTGATKRPKRAKRLEPRRPTQAEHAFLSFFLYKARRNQHVTISALQDHFALSRPVTRRRIQALVARGFIFCVGSGPRGTLSYGITDLGRELFGAGAKYVIESVG